MKKFILSAVILITAAAFTTSSAQTRVRNHSASEWRRSQNKVGQHHPNDDKYYQKHKVKKAKHNSYAQRPFYRNSRPAKIKSNNGRGNAYGHYKGKARGKAKGHY